MKRKSRILIMLLSAIITFATLAATIGKPPYMKCHSHFSHCEKATTPTTEQK